MAGPATAASLRRLEQLRQRGELLERIPDDRPFPQRWRP
jgi:hypothetical protein